MNIRLQREEELLSSWWKEYAECSEGPSVRPSSSAKLNSLSKASSLNNAQSSHLYALEEERVGVPVKGGLYEVLPSFHTLPSCYQCDSCKLKCFKIFMRIEFQQSH